MINLFVYLIVYLLVIGVVYWLVMYVVDAVPIPQPANRVVKIAVTVLCVLAIVILLLNLIGADTGVNLPGPTPKP